VGALLLSREVEKAAKDWELALLGRVSFRNLASSFAGLFVFLGDSQARDNG
jgi:hypothetical protein